MQLTSTVQLYQMKILDTLETMLRMQESTRRLRTGGREVDMRVPRQMYPLPATSVDIMQDPP
jgi:hypothetical protein